MRLLGVLLWAHKLANQGANHNAQPDSSPHCYAIAYSHSISDCALPLRLVRTGRDVIAPREVVWAAILNPEVLKACVPGCTEMTGSPEDGFEAVVVQKVGPVKATFNGVVSLCV